MAIDVTGGDLATARVECSIHPRYFDDHLTLLRTASGWLIVAKAFRTELRDAP